VSGPKDAATRLSVERLFDNPPLTGRLPVQLKFSPDGRHVAYLQTADDDRERLDLWRLDLTSGERRCWLNARELLRDAVLTNAEKAERERRRLFSHGITAYHFSPDGSQLLIPVDGAGYLFDVTSETLRPVTSEGTRQTDFRFSPLGGYLSYVRANDLYHYHLGTATETAVTTDGSDLVANGIADFIAQEEMHRFNGHWWAPDDSAIAYTRTDVSAVDVSQRYEIDADAFNVIEQRYPFAGQRNADVELLVHPLDGSGPLPVAWRHGPEDYLARISWAGRRLLVQVQSRNQQILHLDAHSPETAERTSILTERSETWINLHDNLKVLDDDRLLWTSERDGGAEIYLCHIDGAQAPRRLTDGPGRVDAILATDDTSIYYAGWRETPAERHLYSVPLEGGSSTRLSAEAGWHDMEVHVESGRYADRFTSLSNMGEIRIRRFDGQDPVVLAAENGDPGHPYAPFLETHITPRIGELQAEDGQTLYYRLTEPADIHGRHPLIVYVYGGPGANRVRNEWAPLLLQLFASRGFGVLELDNRGSANREPRFESPIYRRLGDVEVRDQLAGVAEVKQLDWVDGDRIGVFGHSYGGFMTLMCLAKAPGVFRAGVSVAPVSDWTLYDTHYTERYLSTPTDNPQGYQASAVFPYLDQLRGRLLIMHGMADDNVLFTHSTRLFKALQNRRYPFEMMTYPGSKHSLQEQDVSVHRFNMILEFFSRSLT
jgi:dipeptidyl-peptidase-4